MYVRRVTRRNRKHCWLREYSPKYKVCPYKYFLLVLPSSRNFLLGCVPPRYLGQNLFLHVMFIIPCTVGIEESLHRKSPVLNMFEILSIGMTRNYRAIQYCIPHTLAG